VSAANAEKVDEVDLEEKRSSKMMKRKLPAPKHGRLDASVKVHQRDFDRNLLFRHLTDIFWKLRKSLREQAEVAPNAHNVAERALGFRRRNLPNPAAEYNKLMKERTICQALDLGIDQLNEAGSGLYIQHEYNSAVSENFVGDEFFGADRKLDTKDMMRAFVKEV
jgi:hypothetical protein